MIVASVFCPRRPSVACGASVVCSTQHGHHAPRLRAWLPALSFLAALSLGDAISARAEFQVNTLPVYASVDLSNLEYIIDGFETIDDIATATDNSFVVVYGGYTTPTGISGQRFTANGVHLGGEFSLANTGNELHDAEAPKVAIDSQGHFIVVWSEDVCENNCGFFHALAQRFDGNGATLGGQFQIGQEDVIHLYPDVAVDASGNDVIAWRYGSDVAQRLDPNGLPLGPEIQVSTSHTGPENAVASAADGSFVVVWDDDYLNSINAQRIDSSGVPIGSEIHVNTSSPPLLGVPDVASAADGGFIVVWNSWATNAIFGQRFSSTGVPMGAEFQVNSQPAFSIPKVSGTPDGAFIVAWTGGSTAVSGAFAREFANTGLPLGAEFQVDAQTDLVVSDTVVSSRSDGGFTVAWIYDPLNAVFAQRFASRDSISPIIKLNLRFIFKWFWFMHIGEPNVSPGDVGDLVRTGVTLTLWNPTSGERAEFFLPPGASWKALRAPGAYKYTDRSGLNGPCQTFLIVPGKTVLVKCRTGVTTAPPYPLAATQGSVNVAVQFGTGVELCAATAGGTVQHDVPTSRSQPRGLFTVKNAPASDACQLP